MNKINRLYRVKTLLFLPTILLLFTFANAQQSAEDFFTDTEPVTLSEQASGYQKPDSFDSDKPDKSVTSVVCLPSPQPNKSFCAVRRDFERDLDTKRFDRNLSAKSDDWTNRFDDDDFLTQKSGYKFNIPVKNPFENHKISVAQNQTEFDNAVSNEKKREQKFSFSTVEREKPDANFDFDKFETGKFFQDDDDKNTKSAERFHWKPALIQSGIFLGIQHGFRMTQKKTTRELGGPFFRDWGKSVKNLGGWEDGDSFFVNYIAHPMQGSATGRIFINNSDKAKRQEFGKSKEYWESRLKAMAWSALWSTQFELGPISEASLGNVGIHDKVGRNRMGWVDMIITPTAGTGFLIVEDIIDKCILKNWLERNASSTKIKVLRSFLTPTTSFANLLRGKYPWKRDYR